MLIEKDRSDMHLFPEKIFLDSHCSQNAILIGCMMSGPNSGTKRQLQQTIERCKSNESSSLLVSF